MKKIVSSLLALVCVASVCLAKDDSAAYVDAANKQIAKIMNSDKDMKEKFTKLIGWANKLAAKKELSEKQKIELREIYFVLGKANYNTVHNYAKAAEFFDKAIVLKDDAVTEYYKANSLFYSKNYADAVSAYRKALDKGDLPSENFPNLFWLKGCAEYYTGDYGAAENDLKKAISLDGTKWEKAARYIVVCLQKRGNHEEALLWLEKLGADKKTLDFALRKKADIYCEIGRYNECEQAIRDLEATYPMDDALCLLKAQLSYARGDYKETAAQLDKEFSKEYRKPIYNYECYIMRAQLALQDKNYKEALEYVDNAVREPMPAYSTKLRGDIYLAMGDKAKALEFYRAFLKISPSATRNAYISEKVAKLQNELQEEAMRPENQ